MFDKILNRFLNSKVSPSLPVHTCQKDVRYLKFPYLGPLSYEIRNSLNKILRDSYPQINFKFVFSNSNTIGNFLKSFSTLPTNLQSNVVYQYECSSCHARYVGSTSRWLLHRILEHQGKSTRTGKFLAKPPLSSISEHSHQCDHPFFSTDFRILTTCQTRSDLITIESIFINKIKPSLNNASTATPLFTQ